MFQKFPSTAFVVATLLTISVPAVGFAQGHGNSRGGQGRSTGRSGGQSFSGGNHYSGGQSFSGGNHYSGGQSFASPRGYSGGGGYYGRAYVAPRYYGRPVYRGSYGGVYFGYGSPYGYAYAPGYAYGPPVCTPGAYDRYGNWIPNPYCGSAPPPQQYYGPAQPQYPPQQQQYYDPNQQPYPPSQQQPYYDPNSPQPQRPIR